MGRTGQLGSEVVWFVRVSLGPAALYFTLVLALIGWISLEDLSITPLDVG